MFINRLTFEFITNTANAGGTYIGCLGTNGEKYNVAYSANGRYLSPITIADTALRLIQVNAEGDNHSIPSTSQGMAPIRAVHTKLRSKALLQYPQSRYAPDCCMQRFNAAGMRRVQHRQLSRTDLP